MRIEFELSSYYQASMFNWRVNVMIEKPTALPNQNYHIQRHIHFNKEIVPKEMKLELFNSILYCKYFLESRMIMKLLGFECTTLVSTNVHFFH